MKRRYALLVAALTAACTSGVALAQNETVFDPAQLPEVKGKVVQYLLTPRGDVDGFFLADGTEVHVAPHLSTQLVYAVKPGDTVTIHGVKAKAAPLLLAASVSNDATGATVQGGPHGRHGGLAQVEANGRVKAQLHTPRGEVDGVLLQDGTIVRLPPPEAQKLNALLANDQPLFVRGFGFEGALGKVVAAQELGADKEHAQPVAGPHPPGPGGHFRRHGPWHGGPGGHGPDSHGPDEAPPGQESP